METEKFFIALMKDITGVNGEGKVLHNVAEGQNGGEWRRESSSYR